MVPETDWGHSFFAISFMAHKGMYYKKQTCCTENAYKNLCPNSVYKVIIIFYNDTEKSTKNAHSRGQKVIAVDAVGTCGRQ